MAQNERILFRIPRDIKGENPILGGEGENPDRKIEETEEPQQSKVPHLQGRKDSQEGQNQEGANSLAGKMKDLKEKV